MSSAAHTQPQEEQAKRSGMKPHVRRHGTYVSLPPSLPVCLSQCQNQTDYGSLCVWRVRVCVCAKNVFDVRLQHRWTLGPADLWSNRPGIKILTLTLLDDALQHDLTTHELRLVK